MEATVSEGTARKSQEKIEVFSPINGEKIGEVKSYSLEEALVVLSEVRAAQKEWAKTPFSFRSRKMLDFLEQLYLHADELANLISKESGKTKYEAYLFEIVPIMHLTSYFADNAEKILKPKKISISVFKNRASYIHYKPRGVMLVISPWNFPMSIPVGEVVMGLMAGNGIVLKPASLTPLIALKVRELFDKAGLDKKLFQVIPGPGRMASSLIEAGVDYVNFTGSTDVGKKVAELCGRNLIPCSMELGGKDPALIFADADLDAAAKSAVWGAFSNSGQVCASVERIYVQEPVYEQFVEKVVELTKRLRQGDPLGGEDVDIGAMTDPGQIKIIEEQVEDAVRRGAKILTGGKRASFGKMFFEPTVIVDADESMKVVRDESFGPVVPIMKFQSEAEAIARANDSIYGLNAYVFTRDGDRARRVAERLEAGTVMINDVLMTHAFPETPWGGVKQSGIGRVHSDDGLRDLCHAYHVNYDLFSMDNPVWYPYSRDKVARFIAAANLIHRKAGFGAKLRSLKGVISPEIEA
ncbi:MAG: aldehyde dehydrogenase family protein [Myxococcota bacterium]